MATNRKTGLGRRHAFAPQEHFSTHLGELADFYQRHQLSFKEDTDTGAVEHSAASLTGLKTGQEGDEAKETAAWDAFLDVHNPFLSRQAGRFRTFMQALEFARTASKRNPERLAELARLKQTAGRAIRSAGPAPEEGE